MSSDQSSGKGKAVVVKEEPMAGQAEHEIWLVKNVHHRSSAAAEGSSSMAPSQPAANNGATAPPLPTTKNVSGPQQHGGNQSLFLKNIILNCVAALDMGNAVAASAALQHLSSSVSTAGDPLQRVALAFSEALGCRALRMLRGLAWAVQLQVPPKPPLTATTRNGAQWGFGALCPLVRVAAAAANHAILDAVAAEHRVHVVDLGGANPNQWLELLRLLAERPRGPPSLRLSIINDEHNFLWRAAGALTQEAVRLHIPFVFNPVRSHIDHFAAPSVAELGVDQQGKDEALVITSTLQLHRLIADKVTVDLPAPSQKKRKNLEKNTAGTTLHQITKADALLRVLCDLKPMFMVLTEQEADHNGEALSDRVGNAFDYYAVLFRDLEPAGGYPMRAFVENMLLREEIKDIVSCDGTLRRERHEKLVHWLPRIKEAGFELAAVSDDTFKEAASLAHQLSGDGSKWVLGAHKLGKGCLHLYSRKIAIFSVSAWQPVKKDR
jgi:hypothetical protein